MGSRTAGIVQELREARGAAVRELAALNRQAWEARSAADGRPTRVAVHEAGERILRVARMIVGGSAGLPVALDPERLAEDRADHARREAGCAPAAAFRAFRRGTALACRLLATLDDADLDRAEVAIRDYLFGDIAAARAAAREAGR